MKYFEELENLIKNRKDWLEILKPYLKSAHEISYNPDWVILMYNLFDIPENADLFKVICECRGSVVNKKTGEIICAPFVKFWNYGEPYADKNIDFTKALYTHKRDGWMCKLIKRDDGVHIFTNGMWLSDDNRGAPVETSIHPESGFKDISDVYLYCLGAKGFDGGSVIWDKVPSWIDNLESKATVMFELESPWNVIHTHLVEEPKLWLTGYRNADGYEYNVWKDSRLSYIPYDRPELHDFKSAEQMVKELSKWSVDEEGEGIVVLYIDNDGNFHRVKIKCEDYLRVKYLEDCSAISDNKLFSLMLSGEADDLVAAQPSLKDRIAEIKSKVSEFENLVKEVVKDCEARYNGNRKEFVEYAKTKGNKFSLYMKCLTGYDKTINDYMKRWNTKNGYDELLDILK